MIYDVVAYAKRCHVCQLDVDFIYQTPKFLHPTTALWPFENWGIKIIRPINPPSTKRQQVILAITNYFSKWVEAIPLKEAKAPKKSNY